MKTVQWEEGNKGSCWHHPPKDGQMLNPSSKVTIGMEVSAKFKGESIRLRILQETEPENFKASIMGYYFLNTSDELNEGDEISIDREHILWLFGRD